MKTELSQVDEIKLNTNYRLIGFAEQLNQFMQEDGHFQAIFFEINNDSNDFRKSKKKMFKKNKKMHE